MPRRSSKKVEIKKIPSGVPGLDVVLGGGIPALSVNMVVGAPGVGKTSLTHQILFHNATPNRRAIYFVALGEPTLKMLRYQQQFDFFDSTKIERSILYHDLGTVARQEGLTRTLEVITRRVEEVGPEFVVIDSFRGLVEIGQARGENVRAFVQDLSAILATWNVTSFLLGEYVQAELESLPEFSAADGIIWLAQHAVGSAVVRKLQGIKMRGQGVLAGRHTYRITSAGIEIFPRMLPLAEWPELPLERDRVQFGVAGLDAMLGGGIPRGEATLIAGSSGTGKTLLGLHFIAEGIARGEPSVMVTFEEHPREHERKAIAFGWDLKEWERQGRLGTIYLRPLDLSVDEVLARIHEMVARLKAQRVVVNSISGFEVGISTAEESEFRESLFRLIATLSGQGITTVLTTEIPDFMGDFRISPQAISFLADNIVVLRYAEIQSQLRRMVMVLKMRTSNHDKDLRQFRVTNRGVVVERPFTEYSGVLSGIPTLRSLMGPQPFTAGLADEEETLMHVLLALGEATPDQLAEGMGLEAEQVSRILDKLVDTGYVARLGTRAEPRFRVALVTPGSSVRRR